MRLALIFPGQGAQKIGLGHAFLDQPTYRHYFEEASDLLGYNLLDITQTEKIHETQYTQVALFTASLATLSLLELPAVSMGMGLSLGEYTATVAAGKISFTEFLPLIKMRGEKMAEQAKITPGIMVAVVGATREQLEEACARAARLGVVQPCNFNTPQQTVIGGTVEAVDAVVADLKAQGLKKLIPLKVSGAFHSPLFADVATEMEHQLSALHFAPSQYPILSNVTGGIHTDADFGTALAQQIASPVQMVTMAQTLADNGITHTIEVGCRKVVSQLIKKNQPHITTFSVGSPASLDELKRELEVFNA